MSEQNKMRNFSMRYCPNLHETVVVMTESPIGKPQNKLCLSSHLCQTDVWMRCHHTDKPQHMRDADVLGKIPTYR